MVLFTCSVSPWLGHIPSLSLILIPFYKTRPVVLRFTHVKEQAEVKGFSLNTIFFAEHHKIVATLVRLSGIGTILDLENMTYYMVPVPGQNRKHRSPLKRRERKRKGHPIKHDLLFANHPHKYLLVHSILLSALTCSAVGFRETKWEENFNKILLFNYFC